MAYRFLMNGECLREFLRYKWVSLGRTQASQGSNGIDELGRMFTWGQNYNAQSGQGNCEFISSGNYGKPDLVDIECATQLGSATNWIKSCSGELSTVALNSDNELWGWGNSAYDCSAFGLPPDSGEGHKSWMGVPDPGNETLFFTPVRVAPGYNFKDVAHDLYHTVAIGMDDKLYTFGYNGDYALGAGVAEGDNFMVPILNPTLVADIKLIDCEYLVNVAVTTEDKVYIWGEQFWSWPADLNYPIPTEITGLVIPIGETIVSCSVCSYGILILLSNGELWAAGDEVLFGDQGVSYPLGSTTLKQIPALAAKNIVKVRATSLGATSVFVIDSNGNIWGFSGDPDWYTGNAIAPVWNTWNSIADTNVTYVDVINNTHNNVYQAIDDQGYLWTWGSQWWGPHLAICVNDDEVDLREIAGLAAPAVDALGNPVFLNNLEGTTEGLTDYDQPLPQTLRHKPCGHWHLRLFEEEPPLPGNCWMCSLAIKDNLLLFVAAGKHLQRYPGTGNELLMFTYDIDANIWTLILYDQLKNASTYPGGAATDTDIYAFANYKAKVTGTLYNEVYTDYAMGVWVVHSGAFEYVEFADSIEMSGQNNLGVYTSGMVALAYTNNAEQLIVKVSTDSGATYITRRTIAALAARKDFSLVVDDDNGYIYLAHQISTSAVKIERSIDNGLNWTTQKASETIIADLEKVKLVVDNDMLFLICGSGSAGAIERSSDDGVSWDTIPDEPSNSIVASGCNVDDGHDGIALAVADSTMYNYIYDGGYDWFERDITQMNVDGTTLDVIATKHDSDLAGYSGRFAYAAFGFYTIPEHYIAVSISSDRGAHWDVRATPLTYFSNVNEITDFQGCPLFCLTDVPYLNHVWKFEKSNDSENWANDCGFVKQKDKYEKVLSCSCPCKITKTV